MMELVGKTEVFVDDDTGAVWTKQIDVNRDGLQDFVIYTNSLLSWGADFSNPPYALTRIFTQTGDGHFRDSTDSYIENNVSPLMGVNLSLGELNKDGVLDFVLAGSGWDPYIDGKPSSPEGWVIGEPDIFFVSGDSGKWDTYDTGLAAPWTHDVAVGDINSDGYDDVYSNAIAPVRDYKSFFSVFGEEGNFELTRSNLPAELSTPLYSTQDWSKPTFIDEEGTPRYADERTYTGSLLFDANGDGFKDLALFPVENTKNGIIYINDGSGFFGQDQTIPLPAGAYGPGGYLQKGSAKGTIQLEGRAADIDNDGDSDLIILSTSVDTSSGNFTYYAGTSVEILKNNGEGVFTISQRVELIPPSAGNYKFHHAIELLDIDRDGQIDVVLHGNNFPKTYYDTEILRNVDGLFERVTETYIDDTSARYYPFHTDGVLHLLKHEFVSTDYDEATGNWFSNLVLSNYSTGFGVGNVIAGHAEAEHLIGSTRSDRFLISDGSDVLDGLSGSDTLVINAMRSDVKLTDKIAYTEVQNESVTTAAYNIERLEFTDKKVAVDFERGENSFKAAALITTMFGSDLIPTYFAPAVDLIDQGSSIDQIAQLAIDLGLVDASSNENFFANVYENVVGVEADPSTQALYVSQLDSGELSQAELVVIGANASIIEAQMSELATWRESGLDYLDF